MTVKENEKRLEEHGKTLERLTAIVVGNGKRGMDEIVREIERRIGVLESEFSHFRKIYFEREGLDAMGNKEKDNKSWWEKSWDRTADTLFDKLMTAVIIVILLNIPDLIEALRKLFGA